MVQTIEPSAKEVAFPGKSTGSQNDLEAQETDLDRGETAFLTDNNLDGLLNPPSGNTRQSVQPEPEKLLKRYETFLIPLLFFFILGNVMTFALPDLAFAQLRFGLPLLLFFAGIIIYGINKPENRWAIRVNFWMIAFISGSMFYHYHQFAPGADDISRFAPTVRAEIMGTIDTQISNHKVIIDVSQLNRKKVSGHIMAYLPQTDFDTLSANPEDQTADAPNLLAPGTRILIDGELVLPFQSDIPGVFNQAEYLKSQHISTLLKKPSRMIAFERSNQPRYVVQRFADQLKQHVAETFNASLPSPHAEILGGIVLGDKAIAVDRDTKQAFIQTGLIHVLAASGLNVGIIAGAVLWLMSRLKAAYRKQLMVAMVAVAFYSLLTGLPPSILRASVMLELALFLKLLNRELSPVFLLGVATTLLVLFNPDSIGSIGFQFSVLTTLGLLLMVPPLQEVLGYYITRGLAGLILVPLVAQLWIWPLSIAYFNQFPVHSVPLNILAMALVAPLTILGFTAGVVSLLLPPLAGWLSSLALPFVSALLSLVQWGNAMTWAQWQLPSPSELEIGAFYMGLLMLTIIIDRFKDWSIHRRALLGLLPVLIILGSLCLSSADAQSHNKVTLLPLSYRHESILIESSQPLSTRLILMPSALTYYEARALADYLKHRQIRKLNLLVLLPGESVNPSDAQSPGGPGTMLKTAFKHTQIDRLLMPTETSGTTSLLSYLSPQKQTVYPAQGIDVNAGSITIEGRANDLRVKNGAYCLIEISSTRNPSDASCGVQLAQNPRGETRLFSEKQNFPTDHFYQLVQQGKSLKIY